MVVSRKKHIRGNRNKTTIIKGKYSKIPNTNKSKNNVNSIVIVPNSEKNIEAILLYKVLFNYILMMKNNGETSGNIKKRILELLKEIRNKNNLIGNKTSDKQLNLIFKVVYNHVIEFDKTMKTRFKEVISNRLSHLTNKTHKNGKVDQYGGFYFKNLEEKGDQPITGADLTRFLDEMQQFFYNAQYTEEGKFLQDTNTVVSMLRGDLQQFKSILQYRIFPKYYSPFPPFLKWGAIKTDFIDNRKWEDLPDYLLAYQSYLRSRDEYLVEKGMKSPSVLNKDLYTGFFNKMANSLDQNIQKFQQYRNKAQGNLFPIALPP